MNVKLEDIVSELWKIHNETVRKELESNIGTFTPGTNTERSKTVSMCIERIVKKFSNN